MAVLNWRAPVIQVSKLDQNGKPDNNWLTFPESVRNSSRLNTDPGNETIAEDEDGGIVDSFRTKGRSVFETTIFVKKGDVKQIEDTDGIVAGNFAVRWAPKDAATTGVKGRQMLKTSVSVVETWSSDEGSRLTYTFSGLVPGAGKRIVEEYQPEPTPPSDGGGTDG